MLQEEFNKLVVSASASLMPFAINLTKNTDAAEDLLQETTFRALVNHDKFSEGTNLKAWLFTIMRNIFINNYRKMAKRNTIIDTTDNLFFINSTSTVKNHAEQSFVMDDLQNAIAQLNSDFKVPFMMHYEGYKYNEIADTLHLPLGTVKSRIFFARKELKSILKKMQFSSTDNCLSDIED